MDKLILLYDLAYKLRIKKEELESMGDTFTDPNKLPRKKEWKLGSYYYYENYTSKMGDLIVREDGYFIYDGENWIPSERRETTFHISEFKECFLKESDEEGKEKEDATN